MIFDLCIKEAELNGQINRAVEDLDLARASIAICARNNIADAMPEYPSRDDIVKLISEKHAVRQRINAMVKKNSRATAEQAR